MEYDLLKQSRECYNDPSIVSHSVDYDVSSNRDNIDAENSRDVEMLAEAKLLRQHKGRLESRMQVLEEHNQQLEWQLSRLRQLLDQVSANYCQYYVIFCFCFSTVLGDSSRCYSIQFSRITSSTFFVVFKHRLKTYLFIQYLYIIFH